MTCPDVGEAVEVCPEHGGARETLPPGQPVEEVCYRLGMLIPRVRMSNSLDDAAVPDLSPRSPMASTRAVFFAEKRKKADGETAIVNLTRGGSVNARSRRAEKPTAHDVWD